MIVDLDDWYQGNSDWPRLEYLRTIRPDFKATLFAVPGHGRDEFWKRTPDWLELAVHGWKHPDPHECSNWSRERMLELLDEPVVKEFFVPGFKAPGWQISDGCYQALLERDYWVADQQYNNGRRPPGLRTHLLGSKPEHLHLHVQDVCGNGIREIWDEVVVLVRVADSFQFVSEVVSR